jgi:hypothetical protein
MESIFWVCVKVMVLISHLLGISYQQLNVILFVIIHPLITVILYFLYKKYKNLSLQNQNKENNKSEQ